MTTKQAALSLICVACCIVSGLAGEPAKMKERIAYYKAHDPIADATNNHQKGTVYVIGAMGVGSYYPGIDQTRGDQIAKAHSAKWLPDTSDAIESDLHQKYIDAATSYAKQYNQTTVKLLDKVNKP